MPSPRAGIDASAPPRGGAPTGIGRAAALLLLALLALAPPLLPGSSPAAWAAVGDPRDRLADPALEQRAEEIGRQLRCLVCQNQSIEDSNADLARDLRLIVRERVAAGDSDAAVMDFVHARYGDFVLLRPPFSAATALLWAAPALVLLAGLAAILTAARRRTRAGGAVAAEAELSAAERARLAAIEAEEEAASGARLSTAGADDGTGAGRGLAAAGPDGKGSRRLP